MEFPMISQAYLSNQTTRANGRSTPNSYTSKNCNTSANETIIFNHDTLSSAGAAGPISSSRIRSHRRGVEAHIGSDNDIISDSDFASINHRAVLADDRVLANLNVVAVVASEGGLYHYVLANTACMRDG